MSEVLLYGSSHLAVRLAVLLENLLTPAAPLPRRSAGSLNATLILSECTYEAEVNLLWTPHNLAFLCALRAQIPTAAQPAETSRGGVVSPDPRCNPVQDDRSDLTRVCIPRERLDGQREDGGDARYSCTALTEPRA